MSYTVSRALLLHAAAREEAPNYDAYQVKLYDTNPADAAEVYTVTGAAARALFRLAWSVCAAELNTMSHRHTTAPPEAPPPPESDRQTDARETWESHRIVCLPCRTATCRRGHELLYEYAKTLTAPPPGPRQSPFFAHLDACPHCRANVHNLCQAGETALNTAAASQENKAA